MTKTTKYHLKKPEGNDFVGPWAFNDNAELIAAALHSLEVRKLTKDPETGKLPEAMLPPAPTADKATPADADWVTLADTAAANARKKLTWSGVKATLKGYFDNLYAAATHTHAWSAITGKPSTFAPSSHTHTAGELTSRVPVPGGGTGSSTAAGARANLGACADRLADETAEILGLDPADDPTVNDGFIASVLSSKNACLVKVTVTMGGAPAKDGIIINGLTGLSSGACVTNSNGIATGFTTSSSTTISTHTYLDMDSVSKTISTPLKTIVSAVLTLNTAASGTRVFTTSGTFRLSPYATTMDVCCVGGGGGGAGGSNSYGGGGGGGGYVTNRMGIAITPSSTYTVSIGAGGSAIGYGASGASAGNGGSSSVTGPSLSVIGSGGAGGTNPYLDSNNDTLPGLGGTGNGNGGGANYTNARGKDGSVRRFGEVSGALYSGGGGAGGMGSSPMSGGSPYGGSGYDQSNGQPGYGPGGGGGGGGNMRMYGGSGYRGEVVVRWSVSA